MAAERIDVNKGEEAVRMLINGMKGLRENWNLIDNAFAAFNAMKDGDGSLITHFDVMAARCITSAVQYDNVNTAAKRLYDEANSVHGNLATGVAASEQLAGLLGV